MKRAQLNLTIGTTGACCAQGPGRATETESAVCRCLLSTGGCGAACSASPERAGREHAARHTRAHAHTQLSGDLPFLPPFPKPNSDHLLKYFCKSSLFWEGLGAELVVYIVSGISAVLFTSVSKLFPSSSPLVLKNQCEAPVNLPCKFLQKKKIKKGIKKTAAQVMHTFSC